MATADPYSFSTIIAQARRGGAGGAGPLFPSLPSLNLGQYANNSGFATPFYTRAPGPSSQHGYQNPVQIATTGKGKPGTSGPGFSTDYWWTHPPLATGPTVATKKGPPPAWQDPLNKALANVPDYVPPSAAGAGIDPGLAALVQGAANATPGVPGITPVSAQTIGLTKPPDDSKYLGGLLGNVNTLQNAGLKLAGSGGSLLDYLKTAAQYQSVIDAPALQSLLAQSLLGRQTLSTYNQGAMQLENQVPQDVASVYNQAMNVQAGASRGAQQMLAGANPNAAEQNIAIDPSQRVGLTQQANTLFNQGGAVQGGLGMLGVGSLAAQAAAEIANAQQQPGLTATAGAQALAAQNIGSQAAFAKFQAASSANTFKLAGTLQSEHQKNVDNQLSTIKGVIGSDMSMYKTVLGHDDRLASLFQSGNQFNAGQIQSAAAKTAQLASDAVGHQISAQNAEANTLRANMALYKLANPTATLGASASASKAMDTWATQHAGLGKQTGTVKVPVYETNSDGTPKLKNGQPVPKTILGKPQFTTKAVHADTTPYAEAVNQFASTFTGGNTDLAKAHLANYYNIGYGWDPSNPASYDQVVRPFDPRQQAVLQAAGQPQATFLSPRLLKGKQPFILPSQALALAQGGYGSWVKTLQKRFIGGRTYFFIPQYKA